MDMKSFYIPGLGELNIDYIVFDYNGTIAIDGKLIDGVAKKIQMLARDYEIYVLTADTFGTAEVECEDLDVTIKTINSEDASTYKRKVVESLGDKNSICVGNGYNDIEMFKVAGLSICTMQSEGTSGKLFMYSDIVTKSISDAIDIIMSPSKIKATLRG